MDSIREYVISIVCAAIITSIVTNIISVKNASNTIIKLICSIFLLFTLLSPLPSLDFSGFSALTDTLYSEAEAMSVLGQSMTEESMARYIKEEAEAYILDKATAFNGQLNVELTLDSKLQPESAVLTGVISPYGKFRLESILEEDLGIAKENQHWNES